LLLFEQGIKPLFGPMIEAAVVLVQFWGLMLFDPVIWTAVV
jgi:hypothetical protein